MTEDDARDWLATHYPAARIALLEQFVTLLLAEAGAHSLIARSTFTSVWARHIVDSAQLVALVEPDGNWLDIGSGGGLPGVVVAILRDAPIVMAEPRRKRADFLQSTVDHLELGNVGVLPARAQDVPETFSVISARAVAPLDDIFAWTTSAVSRETHYVLQRGRNWQEDMALAARTWHGAFHVEHSITNKEAGIVLARDVQRI